MENELAQSLNPLDSCGEDGKRDVKREIENEREDWKLYTRECGRESKREVGNQAEICPIKRGYLNSKPLLD